MNINDFTGRNHPDEMIERDATEDSVYMQNAAGKLPTGRYREPVSVEQKGKWMDRNHFKYTSNSDTATGVTPGIRPA
uniref:Uncharacterized protein n=1 Tax=Candidatus Kentrum eta TaxID=2126337 RepID=A0A450V8F8_9GAMM|nr:MAG: hypothetical protein BECKH772B_GA0070898_102182 [Candidatus Kentron sp. H]VFK01112.1 MAG: hypothetical protein BECKH772A_GA0070896_102144 [Candidatus Kentron sp. H]VFK04875.1 MAG: hypothetical protein BECKH772C_GA0070978_102164 [Candidatus Kentron sp. H]